MLNNIVGTGLIFWGGGAYTWNEVSVSTCGGLIHGGLIFGGTFRDLRYTVEKSLYFLVINTHFCVHIEQFIPRWVLKSIQW